MAINKNWKKEFLKLHFEPDHIEGGYCWCNPVKIVRKGKLFIRHNEQRKVLIKFISSLLE